MMKRGMGKCLLAAMAIATAPAVAKSQEITIVREMDSNNYDPHKSTSRAAAEVLFMLGDTLVSLEPDMKTLSTGLAESWSVSDDGLRYTFKLKEGITFCSGKPLTADDVVYSFERLLDPKTASPVAWRAGKVDKIVAADPRTVEYQLTEPYSELLHQLTQSFATIIDKTEVEKLGEDFGVNGFNGTGPYCWETWTPRDRMTITKHADYKWGPAFYENKGPAHMAKITWQVVPEENTRTVALMTEQTQVTQYVPHIALSQLRTTPGIEVQRSDAPFWTNFMGFKIDRDVVSEKAVRQAINLAVNKKALAEDLFFGEVEPAYSYISQATLDWNSEVDEILLGYDPERAAKLLDEAGWVPGPDGIRVKDGVALRPTLYTFAGSTMQKISEFVQAELLKVGIMLDVNYFDGTAVWGKLATQEFDMFGIGYSYISAGDAINLFFRSKSIPAPNRMNWKDPETDDLLDKGMTALDDANRSEAYGKVLRKVHEEAVWLPLYHAPIYIAHSSKLAPVVPHNNYGAGLYKGLDLRFID
jgi:peptide/nickel transport system substrate-binding protein